MRRFAGLRSAAIHLTSDFGLQLILLGSLCSATVSQCQEINAPIYSEIIPTSSGLPYDPEMDTRESFRAPNGKVVEVLVKGPVGSGSYSRAIRPGETPDSYFPAVVSEAVKAGAHHLVIPKDVYAFVGPQNCNPDQYSTCQPHWTIGQYPQNQVTVPDSISDLDIDFSGSELDFAAPTVGIWILESQRLRLRNFTIDWPSLPIASLGTIVTDPLNPGHNALVIDAQYPISDPYRGAPVQIQAVDTWDGSPHTLDPPGIFDAKSTNTFETYFIFGGAQPSYVGRASAGGQVFSCKSCNLQNGPTDPSCSFFQGCANFDLFAPGTRVIVRHYTYNGFAIVVNWSNDITLENLHLRTGPGMGISVANNGGYRGFRLAYSEIARGPGRLISTASDAINIALQADLILEGNDVGYQGDDSINIHPTTAAIQSVNGAQIGVAGVCDPDPMDGPVRGDALAFFDLNSVYKGTARVAASAGDSCGTLSLTLDHAVAGLTTTDTFLDLTQQATARYIVRDNVFHECRCHGVVVNASYGLIDHNSFFDNSAGAIALPGGAGGQGPGSTNLAITHNLMRRPGQGAQYNGAIAQIALTADGAVLTASAFEKIRIKDNVIEDSPGPAIVLTSTRSFSFARNRIFNSNQVRTAPIDYGTLSTLDAILVGQSRDGDICGNERIGPTTGPVGIDPSDERVSLAPACEPGQAD
jgi:Right handed beta helix region